MKSKNLKIIRRILSVFFFLLLLAIFIDFRNLIPVKYYSYITYFQFFPSVIKSLESFAFITTGFIVVILLALLFGRIYCSFLCPLGVLQDIFIYIRRLFKKKRKIAFTHSKPLNWLRYSFLIASIFLFIFFSVFLLAWIDPYSIFGRIATLYIRPVLLMVNNQIADLANQSGNYFFYHIIIQPVKAAVYVIPTITLGVIIWLTATRGRLFCNTVCPVGTLLGLFSKISFVKIKIDHALCNSCSLCERSCKAECINSKDKTVDMSRCVACYNCLGICKLKAIEYNFSDKKSTAHIKAEQPDYQRRQFILSSFATIGGASFLLNDAKAISDDEPIPIKRVNPVTPPGSQGLHHFTGHCTACQLCVSACPTKVLQPAYLHYGLTGIMQPTMDFKLSLCNYDCVKCSLVCPTGAIVPISFEEKITIQTGIAKFIKNNCVVHTHDKDCGACAEHCPTKACHMVPYGEDLRIPEVTENICIGCGACEFACPAKPYKAIYVEGNEKHLKADLPEEIEIEHNKSEDFPF